MLQVLMLIAEEYVTLYWIIGISLSPFEIVFSNLYKMPIKRFDT